MPLLHIKMIAVLSIFATLWLNVNSFRPSKLSCCKHSQRTSVKSNKMADDSSLETTEDLIVTLPKIMARGLLTGIFDVSKAKDYSRTIDADLAVDLLRDTKHIYHVALEETHGNDAERKNNLTEVIKKAKKFMANRDEVWDRDELKSAIQNIHSNVGKFVCVLGGKSTGKTLVIKNMEKLNIDNVFVVDLRVKGNNILRGLIAVIMERRKFYKDMEETGTLKVLAATGRVVASYFDRGKALEDIIAIMTALVDKGSVEQPLEVLINELVRRVDGEVTLIIDEANLAFTIKPDTKEEDVKGQREALSFFTSLTKVEGKLNVILSSSEHAFPYRLEDTKLGFNTLDLTGFIFAGEVPPNKMYELLTTRWGVGHNLAVTLIDHYGGHIYDILLYLEELNKKGEGFFAMSPEQTNSVKMCLKFKGDKKRMRELLTQIAEKGFAPVSDIKDPEAEVISQYNVGGLVRRTFATVIGLPDYVWGEGQFGLIPSKQSVRLIIARVLQMNPELLADNARADSTSVVYDLKMLGGIEEQLIGLTTKIEEVELEIKTSSDPDEKKQLRKEKEQLREKEMILLRRQDGSSR